MSGVIDFETNAELITCPACNCVDKESYEINPSDTEWDAVFHCYSCGVELLVSKTIQVNYRTRINRIIEPCPYCNCKDVALFEAEDICVFCQGCESDGPYFSEESPNAIYNAIKAWNEMPRQKS